MNTLLNKHIAALCLTFILLLGQCTLAAGQYSKIKPWLEDETVAILSIDISSINTQSVFDEFMYYIAEYLEQAETGEAIKQLTSIKIVSDDYLTQFNNDGIESINFIVSMYDLPSFYIVVPHKSGSECASVKALVQMLTLTELKNVPFIALDTFENIGDVMFIGSSKTLNRLRANSNIDRPDIKKAFETVDSYGIKLLYTPPNSLQKVIEETIFPVNTQADIATGSDLTNSVQWASIGLNLNKKLNISYIAQAKSSEAAGRAMSLIEQLQYQIIEHEPWLEKQYPEINSMLQNIKPQLSVSRLTRTIDNLAIRKSLTPVMEACFKSAKLQAGFQVSIQNVKDIMMASVIYMNDNAGKMPQAFSDLATVDLSPKGYTSPLKDIGTGYILRGSDLDDNASPAMIGVYERFENNGKVQYIVGFMDGHVEHTTEEGFKDILAKDNSLRRKMKLSEKPEGE